MKSIRTQMLAYLMLGAMILFSMLSFFSYTRLKDLPEHTKAQYKEIVKVRADEVSKELDGLVEQIEIISQSPIIKSMDMNKIKEYLPNLVLQEKHRNMSIVLPDGKGWTTKDIEIDAKDQQQYREIFIDGKDYSISQPFFSPYADFNVPVMIIAHAVKNGEQTVGLVNIVVEDEFLNSIVRQMDLKKAGYGWIVNQDGLIVAHPDSSIPLKKRIDEVITEDDAIVQEILNNDSGTVKYIDKNGESILAFFEKIDGAPGWKFISSVSAKKVYEEVEGISNTIMTAIIVGLVLVVAFSFLYSSSISRPILDLKETFEKAADGALHIRADESIPNEIGSAAKSFNKMLDQIKDLTYIDSITGLNNYNGFIHELPGKLETLQKKSGVIAIAIVSFDDFKRINSIGGYEVGNDILQVFAKQLEQFIKDEEYIARFFGDEFILLLYEKEILELKNRVRKLWLECSGEKKVREYEFILKSSIGVSVMLDNYYSIEEIINQATIAKLNAKKSGGNNYMFYNFGIEQYIKEEQMIEKELFHAIENNELYLVYQPIIEATSEKLVAVEALLRWKNEAYRDISPLVIIQIAEQNGSIIEIGKWILKEACRQNKEWQNRGYSPIVMSVNVSALQFEQANFVEMLEQILSETGMGPKYLELEITETNAMSGVEEKLEKMNQIKNMGVRIAIDDFGTGYSSLSYFTQFPIDTLKIDRSFINDMLYDNNSKAIVTTILTMAKAIKIKATAEGVETIEQLEHLKEKGCDNIQGYLISKPSEPHILEQVLLSSLY